ncbi:hypothetical protein PAXRUDRAFT_20102 [Paxillus rubicundulus Ve08.2h10]|uniref:Uncharacterized protein n=1 Tax=Paxillus rubicundulus Ve08.2h10 TaxID=930991 RepID=A0A0D0DAG7_9AGAM|nr:hypothetical protein PAXRUDRAFT_20102 [Paxillus rubicundulus Ve08.2h10]
MQIYLVPYLEDIHRHPFLVESPSSFLLQKTPIIDKKSNKMKKSQKPPPSKTKKIPSQEDPTHGPMTPSLDDADLLTRELFAPEDTDILMQDVDGSEDGSIDMEDIIEEATGKEDRDMVMEDPSSSKDKGRSDVLMEEESDADSDYHMDED